MILARTPRALILAAPLLAAAALATPLPAAAKTLVYCSEGNPEALNPQLVTTTTGVTAGKPMFNSLVEFEPGGTRILPGLAESWTISQDGRVYTFRLREGVKFHSNAVFTPSRTMNADDVVFSLMRQWKEDHPYHKVSGGNYDYFKDLAMSELLDAIEKRDARTVVIRLKRPNAPFLANLAMSFNVVHSAEYADLLLRQGHPEQLDLEPIGTGPFSFVSYQKDVAIRYRVFPDYWGGRMPLDTLVFSITPNPAVRLTKLKAGECHVMAFPNPADIRRIEADPALRLLRLEGLNIGYMSLNVTRAPFDDLRVRRAVNMAIDKQTIVAAVYGGAGTPAKNPIPPTLWSYNDDVKDYPYDPAAARRLLAEAGLAQGFETELWYMPVSRPYNPNGKRIAELIQTDLAKVGIRLKLVTDEWSSYRARLQAGEAAMALFGWTGDNGDPDNFLDTMLGCTAARAGGNNVAKWCNADFDQLITRAKETAIQTERERYYREAQVIAKADAPWVPIAHSVVYMATRKEVTGFRMDPLGRYPFDGVDLEP
ncbi:ABC transporter substrate-binding protein [Prosthecomicrobium hirschii]|uniref:ABC transporter substrate-binding protein n=1 Tax=Prosthecodimorpha hirschii TaxID=665126 RepID=UPI00112D45C6|nr:ABC transporter substrate-binding protein [Prosthecomicrobium hirschii]TPQ50335.1 ABC transporter substrate-binding protein [Prosthecomicrobium hirschii]